MIAFSSCLKQPAKKSSPGRQDMVASGSESSIGGLLFPSALSRKASSTLSTVLALVSKDRPLFLTLRVEKEARPALIFPILQGLQRLCGNGEKALGI